MIREYLKLARSFNAVLTGISPVMGAIAMKQYDIFFLLILFLIGFLGHTYGFVLNDILDYKIDRHSKEIKDRPLVSGTISRQKAWAFALAALITAFILAIYVTITYQLYFSLIILTVSAFLVTIYNLISKKLPLTDIILAAAVFFLVLYGAAAQVDNIFQISLLAWIVCLLGAIQVLFMNIIAGGLKDIENDYKKGANTLAVKLGVRVSNSKLFVSLKYKSVAYIIQLADITLVFLPFFIIYEFSKVTSLRYFQWFFLGIISVIMLLLSYKLLTLGKFDRDKIRKLIGLHYYINFSLVPILLMTLNPWSGILVFIPALGFILSNIILHGTILQPKTM